ncbi:MAG: hemolysin family protein [Eubacteriales bacterium]
MIVLFVICVICSGYFSGSESSFARMNKIRMKNRADDGDKKAKNAMYISNNHNKALTTILIGNNIVNIAGASIATLFVTKLFTDVDPDVLATPTTLITTVIVFIFGEMLPKSFGNDRPDTMARFSAGILRGLMIILKPLVSLFSLISDAISNLFKGEETPSITEEDLYEIIEKAGEQGVVDEEQSDLLLSVLEFPSKTAADVMTPKDKIDSIDINLSHREIVDILKTTPYSRIPVTNGSIDHILGIVSTRTFLREYMANKNFDIRSILAKPHYVRTTDEIQDLLDNMRSRKKQIAIVRDTQNKVQGIVTIEDFLEELVGEIYDENDVKNAPYDASEVSQ